MSDRSVHASDGSPWKSIEQLAHGSQDTGEFAQEAEMAPLHENSVTRRSFMALVSASMALTAAACRRPETKLVPTVKSVQTVTPGMPLEYASVFANRNVAYGVLVKSREGRPVHIKGNNLHPSNRGASSPEMIASLLSLYDPDRIRRARVNRGQVSFDGAVTKIAEHIAEAQASGKRAVVLVDEHCSPSYSALQTAITAAIPAISFVTMPAIVNDNVAIANQQSYGVNGEIVPDLSKAKVIVCVDADPLGADKLSLYHTVRFAQSRTPSKDNPTMSKLFVAEAQYSLTGANADERVRLHPSQIEAFLGILSGGSSAGATTETTAAAQRASAALKAAGAEGVVVAGRHLSPRAQMMAASINKASGSAAVSASNVVPNSHEKWSAIATLQEDMLAGNVHVLITADVNPEYSASREFKAALAKVKNRAAINLHEDETARQCGISIPAAHWLESWGDAVTMDGTLSLQQPLIAPLNDGIPSVQDTLIALVNKVSAGFLGETATYADYVKSRWTGSQADWTLALQNGVVASVGAQPLTGTVAAQSNSTSTTQSNGTGAAQTNATTTAQTNGAGSMASAAIPSGMVLMTVPAHHLYDGRQANNGWLQELPDGVTKITWDNVALISPKTAVDLGLAPGLGAKEIIKANEQIITVTTAHGGIDLPVYVQVGMADNVIVTQLGYGRTQGGKVLQGVGSNAFNVAAPGHAVQYVAAKIEKQAGRHKIATTQNHHTLDDGNGQRTVARWISLDDVKDGNFKSLTDHFPGNLQEGYKQKPLSITPEYTYKGHRWGMVIDMSSCTGCSSCISACQSENNIPVVGKDQVMKGREMHWIRLDRYYVGDMTNPATIVEPMLCQHCENAPCENVCPVAATTHSPEGLNEMTYNRCVGTRYCSNNCPYKVRRFNFLNYNTETRSPLELAFNPDVTVRMRGVMEKCTFCVQRLHEAKWKARDDGRQRINDGEAITACQEACPAGAIIFGDANDPKSKISEAKQNDRGFRVLAELNVRPAVTYLAKVQNTASHTTTNHS